MSRLTAAWLLPLALLADDWVGARSGPFEVLSNAGSKPVRDALTYLEQLRHAVGQSFGRDDATTEWPLRILLIRNHRQSDAALKPSRDYLVAAVASGSPLSRELVRDCARVLIESNSGRMPAGIESGLAVLYSTLAVQSTRVTLGAEPASSERTLDWARVHLLSVNPEYSGKLRVLLRNLGQGVELDPAFRNAFSKAPAEIDKEAQAWLARGVFDTAAVSGKPIDPERAFRIREYEPLEVRVALADVAGTAQAWQAILKDSPQSVEALEGVALAAGDKIALTEAVASGRAGARALAESGDLGAAAKKNPRWGEPHARMAAREIDPARKAQHLQTAATLDPRNVGYWRELAETHVAAQNFAEAARAWVGAERAASTDAERTRIRQIRRELEEQRAAHEDAEKRRIADERARELQRLKDEAMASVRAAEDRANQGLKPLEPGRKVEQWWDGPKPGGKVRGLLERVECIGGRARLVIRGEDKKVTQLLIRAPDQIVVAGQESLTLACGPMKPPRNVSVDYFPKPDPKFGVAGEAAVIEFLK